MVSARRRLPAATAIAIITGMALTNRTRAALDSGERAALVDIFVSTGGSSWTSNANWLVGDPCTNEWAGVECSSEQTFVV
jgi:hypothetical protein